MNMDENDDRKRTYTHTSRLKRKKKQLYESKF